MSPRKAGKFSPVKIILFAILILLFVLVVWFIFLKDDEAPAEFLAPVITVSPERGSLEKTIRVSSQVESGRMITLVPRVAGTLIFLDATPGAPAALDQVIARVDPEPYNLTYLQAQAAFLAAQSTFNRVSRLYENQAATRQNYEEARAAYEASKAQFELAQLNLDYANVRSPMDGIVLMRHATQGGVVDAGMPLATLGDLEDLRIKAAIPEIHYRFFAENWESMPVRMTVRALDNEEFDLVPLSLAPYVSPENRSFLVEYAVPPGDEKNLRPGMFVNVSFVLDRREDVFFLPFRALGSRDRLWYVDDQQRAQFVEYVPDFFNEDYFQIPDELGNRRFILEGQHFISPGQRLNIQAPPSGGAAPPQEGAASPSGGAAGASGE